MDFIPCGPNRDRTRIASFDQAQKLADTMRGKVTLASVDWHPQYGKSDQPRRYMVRLWNWHTQRSAVVHYEEDLADAFKYVGPLDPKRPKVPPRHDRFLLVRDMKQTIVIAVAVIIAGALIAGAVLYTQGQSDEQTTTTDGSPEESRTPEQPYTLKGALVLDGVTSGCGGEDILVSVREGAGKIANEVVPAGFIGFDGAYEFELDVPKLDCYSVVVDGTPVGSYPFGPLEDNGFNIGFIDSSSV